MKIKKKLLKDYFSQRPDISMAYIFGSYAKGRAIAESDLDVAVYFKPEGDKLEWEEDRVYESEDQIWSDVEDIAKKNVDLVVLNRAPSTLAFEVLRTGIPIIIKDRLLYWRFLSRVSFEAIDFMEMVEDYWKIKQRSSSLNPTDRQRLVRLIDFLETELADRKDFIGLCQKTYEHDSGKRRNVERWVENIANCSVDIGKILLASEKRRIPDTYKEMLEHLAWLPGFDEGVAGKLGKFAKLRNILAHEYLDIRFIQIKEFIQQAESVYGKLLDFVKGILNK